MPKIQEMKSSSKNRKPSSYFTVCIPKEWMRVMGWKRGTEILFYPGKEEKTLTLKEMPVERNL